MGGNHKQAVQLYQWNVSMSGAMYEALHIFEVVLRNAMDSQLCKWNATQKNESGQPHREDWLMDPSQLLRRLVKPEEFDKAKRRARRAVGSRPVGHSDVLAQINLGTWRFLFPDSDPGRQLLWREALRYAFPHTARPEAELAAAVAAIHFMRNRVAHLEPLIKTPAVRAQFDNMRRVLGEIDPAAEQWFVSNQRVTPQIKSRPIPTS